MSRDTGGRLKRQPGPGGISPALARSVQIGFLLIALFIWFAVTQGGRISPIFLPPPAAVAKQATKIFPTANFLGDLATTVLSLVAAYAIAVAFGLAVGLLLGVNRFVYDVAEPILAAVYSIPLIVFFPLVLLFAGIGPASKIIFAAFYGFFPIALSTMSGFANVEARYLTYSRALGASRTKLAGRVLLPAASDAILSGMRISLVVTFASVIAGEMIASLRGLGHEITFYSQIMDPARMFAIIGVVIVLTGLVNALLAIGVRTRSR